MAGLGWVWTRLDCSVGRSFLLRKGPSLWFQGVGKGKFVCGEWSGIVASQYALRYYTIVVRWLSTVVRRG